MELLIITHPGLESFVINEIGVGELLHPGVVIAPLVDNPEKLRSALFVKTNLRHFQCDTFQLEKLVEEFRSCDFSFVDKPFRVTVKRHFTGALPFKTVELERRLVSYIEQKYQADFNLYDYKINLRIDLYPGHAHLGCQLHQKDLSKRFIRPYNFSNSIKSNIAYAMCVMAKVTELEEGKLIDLFCGSGNILLEACSCNPKLDFMAIDRSEYAIEGIHKNIEANFGNFPVQLICGDALQLSSLTNHVSIILADPPFGRHMGKKLKFSRFYGYLLAEVRKVLRPSGVFVVRVMKKESFIRVATEIKGLTINKVVEVNQGGFCSFLIRLVRDEE